MKQIPSRCIRAVFIKQLERIYGVALGLAHFFAFFIQDQVVDQQFRYGEFL